MEDSFGTRNIVATPAVLKSAAHVHERLEWEGISFKEVVFWNSSVKDFATCITQVPDQPGLWPTR